MLHSCAAAAGHHSLHAVSLFVSQSLVTSRSVICIQNLTYCVYTTTCVLWGPLLWASVMIVSDGLLQIVMFDVAGYIALSVCSPAHLLAIVLLLVCLLGTVECCLYSIGTPALSSAFVGFTAYPVELSTGGCSCPTAVVTSARWPCWGLCGRQQVRGLAVVVAGFCVAIESILLCSFLSAALSILCFAD